MATKKQPEKDTITAVGAQAKQVIDSLAKGLGVAATELWKIYVRQYIVKGANELFTAIVFFAMAAILWQFVQFWALIPVVVGICFVYGAISCLGNPEYYALNDIVNKVKDFKKIDMPKDEDSAYNHRFRL